MEEGSPLHTGTGATTLAKALQLRDLEWRRLGEDLLVSARVE